MPGKKTIVALTAGTSMVFGVVDASVLNETPLERVAEIKNERVEVRQVGDVVEATLPWKGEPGLTIKADMGNPTAAERLADKRKKEVVTEVLNDSMKIDFILNEKPDTNVFCQTIEGAEDYNFFYQPPLTPEEIADGADRPENVVGSYAVYHKTLKNHKLGETNYETGKAWHIYRPEVWEVNSTTTRTWAELNFENNDLCVTVPQDFLDKAEYPVRVDPTFGYETAGGSNNRELDDNGIGLIVTSPSDVGDVSKITMRVSEFSLDPNLKPVIWLGADGTIVTNGVGDNTEFNVPNESWVDFPYTTQPTLSASTEYFIGAVNDSDYRIYYDTGPDPSGIDDSTNSFTTPETNNGTDNTRMYSIYATYSSTGGAEEETTTPSVIWFD